MKLHEPCQQITSLADCQRISTVPDTTECKLKKAMSNAFSRNSLSMRTRVVKPRQNLHKDRLHKLHVQATSFV